MTADDPVVLKLAERLYAHPWLLIRLLIGTRLLAPPSTWIREFVRWFSGFKKECDFVILSNPILGYGVKIGRDTDVQWYDDLDQAAQALSYHASQWRDSQRTSDPETAPTREPKPSV